MKAQHVLSVGLEAEAGLVLQLHHVLEAGRQRGVQVPVLPAAVELVVNLRLKGGRGKD